MGNLILKPASSGQLILQDEGGDSALSIDTSGNTTLAGTTNNIGTVTSGTFNSTIGTSAVFPAGMVLQTVRDNYPSQTEASSEVKVIELTFTTKKANSKLAYFFCTTLGGYGDSDNVNLEITLETGATANSPSSSNFLPTDNRATGTSTQGNGRQFHTDVLMQSGSLPSYAMSNYAFSDLITTSYAKDTQITMGVFIDGGCWINRPSERANIESGLTTLVVQEIAT